jgi:hypothetical protein
LLGFVTAGLTEENPDQYYHSKKETQLNTDVTLLGVATTICVEAEEGKAY